MNLSEYRILTVESAVIERKGFGSEFFRTTFVGSELSLLLSTAFLRSKGIETLNKGDILKIKGKHGNEDVDLSLEIMS